MRAPSLRKRVLAALAAMVLALGAFAAPALADEAQEPTAILYEDGALVFQLGAEPDPARGDVVATYEGFDTASYGYGGAPWFGQRESIKSVVVKPGIAPASTAWWFADCENLASADLSGLDASKVESMGYMFYGCSSLSSLDLSPLKTSSVTDMDYMFFGCSSLASLDLSPLDTSSVTDMGAMFCNCTSLASLDLSPLDTSKVENMGYMFYGCTSLSSADLSGLETSNVTDMGDMFDGCESLASLDLSGLDTSSVTAMGYMFAGCTSLSSLDLSSFDTSRVERMDHMFSGCTSLASVDLSSFDTSKVENMGSMFDGCNALASLDLSSFDTSRVERMGDMFYGCNKLSTLALGEWFAFKVFVEYYGEGLVDYLRAGLPEPPNGLKWVRDGSEDACTSEELMSDNGGSPAPGVYRWQVANPGYTSIKGATVTAPDQAYTGSALTPLPTVTLDGVVLRRGTDYGMAVYADNVGKGTATVTVTGMGAYNGTASGTFQIGVSIAGATVTAPDQAYTGPALTPAPTVTLDGKTLKAGTDYSVSYKDNTDAGTATVTVTGEGNYSGTASGTFAIAPASLAKAVVTAADQAYTGSALTPAPTVTLDGKTLVAGTDYTASYKDNTEAGTATVTVTGKGSYAGTAKGTFEITAAPEPEPEPEPGPDPEPDPEPADSAWTRLAGSDRFGTMKAITLEGYESADTVLVATGLDFADALAAAGLSGVLKAPIVTTMPGSLSDEAREAIEALGAEEAIILGGTRAVSADVEEQLKAMGLSTSRLAGDNRVDTAVKIWERGGDAWGGTCILSKGWVAADALAAGSFAYADAAPLFLALPDGTLTPETAAAVASFDHVIVLGGTAGDAAIKDATAESLGTSWMRLAGDTRYETAMALATWASGGDAGAAFQPAVELAWDDCAVAFSLNYADALVGVNATGPKASVTLFASTDVDAFTQGVASAVAEHAGEVSHGYVLGGTDVVSDAVKALFEEAAK